MKTNIGISEKNVKTICDMLAAILSNEMTLYIKTRKFHWNVSGQSFMELHKLFESHYKILEEAIDEVAERSNKLGSKTIGTMQEFLSLATIKESPGVYPTQTNMITELLKDHEQTIKTLRKNIDDCAETYKDAGTADFLTGLLQEHETIAWVLRRYINA